MSEIIIHERENNSLSEDFLKANGKKFGDDCVKVLKLLYTGKRYTAKEINDTLDMADGGRRLREIFANRTDVKKQKRYNDKEQLIGMEYWLEIPTPPTKKQIVEKWKEKQRNGEEPFKQIDLL